MKGNEFYQQDLLSPKNVSCMFAGSTTTSVENDYLADRFTEPGTTS